MNNISIIKGNDQQRHAVCSDRGMDNIDNTFQSNKIIRKIVKAEGPYSPQHWARPYSHYVSEAGKVAFGKTAFGTKFTMSTLPASREKQKQEQQTF